MAHSLTATASDDFIIREPDKTYREKSKHNLSSHQLADFRRCPYLYHKKKIGLIPDEDRPAYLLGRAAHMLILEGWDEFKDGYAVGGPINPKTGNPYGSTTKAYAEWADAQGKPVLTDSQYELITNLASGVKANDAAQQLLAEGIPEGVVRAEYCEMPCQSRLDWFDAVRGIVDLKTCDDLTWFESDARRYGYAYQMAFYRSMVAQVTGERFPVHIIAVEKKEPFRCGVWRMGEDVLGTAQKENEQAIERLKKCIERDTWPTGYEDIRIFDWL